MGKKYDKECYWVWYLCNVIDFKFYKVWDNFKKLFINIFIIEIRVYVYVI